MEKHYLDMRNNIIFVSVIIGNILLCILFCFFDTINTMMSVIVNLLTIAGSFGISFVVQKSGTDKGGNGIFEKENLQEIKVNRNNWFKEITGKKGITFLTGQSGIGKSYLLAQLMENFDKENVSYILKENNYFFDFEPDEMTGCEYIILDQFERALPFNNISQIIQTLKSLCEKKIIISIREESVGEIYKLFGFDKDIHIVWLDYKEGELRDIENYLQKLFRGTKEDMKKHFLYSKIWRDVQSKRLSLIQLSLLGKEIQYMEEQYVAEKLDKYDGEYDSVIKDFLQMQLEDYEYSETAYMILYLLCQDQKNQYTNEMIDFQNVTIEPEGKVRKAVDFLLEHGWIKKIKENEKVRSSLTEQCEISHDYLHELFNRLCIEQIDSEVRNNAKYYSANCQKQRKEMEEQDSWKAYTNKVCLNFLNANNKKYLNIGLYIMIFFIIFSNMYILLKDSESSDFNWQLVLIDLMVGESVYYMYNYYYHFLSVYQKRYIIGVLVGCLSCMMPFVLMDYWAIGLGIEVCTVGGIMGFISRRVRVREKDFFEARCRNFFCIGLIIVMLGICYKIYADERFLLALSLFILYGVYMFMGIYNHINKKYIFAIVGKTLYGGRRMKIK